MLEGDEPAQEIGSVVVAVADEHRRAEILVAHLDVDDVLAAQARDRGWQWCGPDPARIRLDLPDLRQELLRLIEQEQAGFGELKRSQHVSTMPIASLDHNGGTSPADHAARVGVR
jgi:hypothetical protein